MSDEPSKKRKRVKEEKLEIKKGEFYEIEDLIKVYQDDLKWCENLKFFKIIKDGNWTGQICCSGECLKPEPIQARQGNGRLRNFNCELYF